MIHNTIQKKKTLQPCSVIKKGCTFYQTRKLEGTPHRGKCKMKNLLYVFLKSGKTKNVSDRDTCKTLDRTSN